jgi:hypothetical protein
MTPWGVGCRGAWAAPGLQLARQPRSDAQGSPGTVQQETRSAAEAVTLERRVQLRCKFHLYRVVTATKLKPHQKLFKQGPRWPSFSVLSSTNR